MSQTKLLPVPKLPSHRFAWMMRYGLWPYLVLVFFLPAVIAPFWSFVDYWGEGAPWSTLLTAPIQYALSVAGTMPRLWFRLAVGVALSAAITFAFTIRYPKSSFALWPHIASAGLVTTASMMIASFYWSWSHVGSFQSDLLGSLAQEMLPATFVGVPIGAVWSWWLCENVVPPQPDIETQPTEMELISAEIAPPTKSLCLPDPNAKFITVDLGRLREEIEPILAERDRAIATLDQHEQRVTYSQAEPAETNRVLTEIASERRKIQKSAVRRIVDLPTVGRINKLFEGMLDWSGLASKRGHSDICRYINAGFTTNIIPKDDPEDALYAIQRSVDELPRVVEWIKREKIGSERFHKLREFEYVSHELRETPKVAEALRLVEEALDDPTIQRSVWNARVEAAIEVLDRATSLQHQACEFGCGMHVPIVANCFCRMTTDRIEIEPLPQVHNSQQFEDFSLPYELDHHTAVAVERIATAYLDGQLSAAGDALTNYVAAHQAGKMPKDSGKVVLDVVKMMIDDLYRLPADVAVDHVFFTEGLKDRAVASEWVNGVSLQLLVYAAMLDAQLTVKTASNYVAIREYLQSLAHLQRHRYQQASRYANKRSATKPAPATATPDDTIRKAMSAIDEEIIELEAQLRSLSEDESLTTTERAIENAKISKQIESLRETRASLSGQLTAI